jgi:hypothetical protein
MSDEQQVPGAQASGAPEGVPAPHPSDTTMSFGSLGAIDPDPQAPVGLTPEQHAAVQALPRAHGSCSTRTAPSRAGRRTPTSSWTT